MSTAPSVIELPRLVRELCDACGLQAALALVRWQGGRRVYVPHSAGEDQRWRDAIGADAASWLASQYGGEHPDIPKAEAYLRALRDEEIRARHESGESANALAGEYGLHVRQVWRILGGEGAALASEVDRRQQSLF